MNQEKKGKFIKEKRKEKGLTQETLAEQLGVSNRSISKWENGKCLPDISLYNDICKILSISVTEFIMGEDIKDNIKLKDSDENINNIINEKNNANSFEKIINLYGLLSFIFSIFLLINKNDNGIYLLIISFLLILYLKFDKIKNSKKIFNYILLSLAFLILNIYLFWLKSKYFLIMSIILFIYVFIKLNKIKNIYNKIKDNKYIFVNTIIIISLITFNIYLFLLNTIYLLLISIILLIIGIFIIIKYMNLESIFYIITIIIFYIFSYIIKYYTFYI